MIATVYVGVNTLISCVHSNAEQVTYELSMQMDVTHFPLPSGLKFYHANHIFITLESDNNSALKTSMALGSFG